MMRLASLALLATLLAACGSAAPSAAEAADPFTCEGYQQPRVYLSAQSGWPVGDSETQTYGDAEHSHSETCFPLYQVVSGTVHFDVVSKLHNSPGQHARVRIQDGSTTLVQADTPVCQADDCTFVSPLDVNFSGRATGTHEIRVHSIGRTGTPGSNSYPTENLATTSWQLCNVNCTVRSTTIPWPQTRGAGWYDTPSIDTKGYIEARLISMLPSQPISGTWCPTVRIREGAAEGSLNDTPVDRSTAYLDPDFHNADPALREGTVLLDQAGTFGGWAGAPLCIDTTRFADGSHRLMLQAHSTGMFPGQLWGSLVVPVIFQNGG